MATILIDVDAKRSYGIRPGNQFRPNDRYVARRFGVKLPKKLPGAEAAKITVAPPIVRSVSIASGRTLFLGTCMSCHGPRGEGLPGQGKSLVANEFVGSLDDAKLLDFVKLGRQPWDPLNTTKVQMPPRGGNPMLSDGDLRDIVAYVRSLQTAAPALAVQSTSSASATVTASAVEGLDPSLLVPRWVVSPPPPGPAGLSQEYLAELSRPKWKPPRDGVAFVNAYYMAAQLGGAHAGTVAIILAALFVQALRGRITAERRAPLALGMVGCAVMTISWLFVFPFVYVI
jgi:disulfide bond formation protein DsbB